MKQGIFKEGMSKGKKALTVLVNACVILFPCCVIAAVVGMFTKNIAVMWIGVSGTWVTYLAARIIGNSK